MTFGWTGCQHRIKLEDGAERQLSLPCGSSFCPIADIQFLGNQSKIALNRHFYALSDRR
jgi:hypothetical protein